MEQEIIRDEQGRFIPGVSGNPDGRPPETEADRIKKKATKELIEEYKEALGEALPLIKPILIAKAIEGDMTAIKEIHDRVMDKSKQPTDITSAGKPIITIASELATKYDITHTEPSEDSQE